MEFYGPVNTDLVMLSQSVNINPDPAEPGYIRPVLANSEEANWSESAPSAIKYVNLYQKPGSSNLIGWKLEVSLAS